MKVKFQGNPLDCSCHVEELKNHLLDRYAYRHELQYESTCCATPEELQGIPLYRINDGAECTFLFGARYSFSHLSEITFILLALIIFAFCFTVLILFIHSRSDRQKKKYADVTQSQSRIALTLSQHLSNSPSSLTEPLTPPPESPISGISTKVPPPPPILTDI
ncbi:unnamed protein product [Thelazia callipaeda]|uniref:LRRCT domain-containing protein n=1 Tax=Thelazia callipaeda TaxID=103827 RepID=A0A0N5CLF7_THECL|nr:unnamed protein product [Thelazia callipaeda]